MQKENQKNLFGYARIKQSAIGSGDLKKTSAYLYSVLDKEKLEIVTVIKLFGKDEVWAVFSFTNPDALDILEDNSSVNYAAVLSINSEFDKKVMSEIIDNHLPVAYLLFKKKSLVLSEAKDAIKKVGGSAFLWGEMKHPIYSHALFFAVKTGKNIDLDNAISNFIKQIGPKEWECSLGASYEWPSTPKKQTGEFVEQMMEEIRVDWIKHADRMSEWEKEEIYSKLGFRIP